MEELKKVITELKSRQALWLDMKETDDTAQHEITQHRLEARITEIDSIIDWIKMEFELED
jgi:hypothetical protein